MSVSAEGRWRGGRAGRRGALLVSGLVASLLSGSLAAGSLAGCGTSQRRSDADAARVEPRGAAEPADPANRLAAAAGSGAASGGPLGATVGEPAGPARPPPPPPPFLDAPAGSLDPFYAGLAAASAARSPSASSPTAADPGRVLITIFGDSHTAGDRFTSRLRHVLGEQFGRAGRGFVAVGKPAIRHYYLTEVRYGSTGKWKAAIGGHRDNDEPFGMAGLRTYTTDRRAQSWVETCTDCMATGTPDRPKQLLPADRASRFELFYWAHPGGAKLRYRVDRQKWQTVPTASAKGAAAHSARLVVLAPEGSHRFTVEPAGPGALSLFGVALERDRPGVIVDGLGVVGRTLLQLAAWDWGVIGAQLAARAPRLVILQYGTNEADYRELDLAALARRYDQVIARVRRAAPGAAILVLGPPDMGVRQDGKACDDPRRGVPPFIAPSPLPPLPSPLSPPSPSAEPIIDGLTGLAVAPPPSPFVDPACVWRTAPRLRDIVAVQRAAARRGGAAFFDSLSALGGAETIDVLASVVPPLAAKDRVHLTALGYARWADALLGELLAGYQAYASHPRAASAAAPAPPASPSLPVTEP